MTNISILGIDLAKQVFQLHGMDERGKGVRKERVQRNKLKEVIAKLPKCTIAMEACGGSHYWARTFRGYGHEVKLISPQFVKPYVKGNKNDMQDAAAIAEAASRPEMRFVPIKERWQQDITSIHRMRERLVKNRTALGNQLRGLAQEYGVVLPQGKEKLLSELPLWLADAENEFTPIVRALLKDGLEEFKELKKKVDQYDQQLESISKSREDCQRIEAVEGIGPITSTALIAAIGDGREFKTGRQLSAWLGVVPRQHSSGGKSLLLGISKRGDKNLRRLLIHGARSALKVAGKKVDRRSVWAMTKKERHGFNKACVAVANKNARIVWALLVHKRDYNPNYRKAA